MIDWDRVTELKEEVGSDEFGDVVNIFLEEVDEAIERLSSGPPSAVGADDLHFLKGCALNLGFRALVALCQRLEGRLASAPLDAPDVRELSQTYAASRAAFLARAPCAA